MDNKVTYVMTREEEATNRKGAGGWNLIQDGGHSEEPERPKEASSRDTWEDKPEESAKSPEQRERMGRRCF